MKWAQSLIRIANHEVETLQKRLAEIVTAREVMQMRLASLHAEAENEQARASSDAEAGFYHLGFLQGWRMRRDALNAQIAATYAEEAGARDALTRAFEELKKFEHVAEVARLNDVKEQGRRENAAMDEMGLRAALGGRG
jgi:flagellar FliJ protein